MESVVTEEMTMSINIEQDAIMAVVAFIVIQLVRMLIRQEAKAVFMEMRKTELGDRGDEKP